MNLARSSADGKLPRSYQRRIDAGTPNEGGWSDEAGVGVAHRAHISRLEGAVAPRPKPVGAPNVVVILLDDTGFAQLGSFGSDIATPNMDRLAGEGLRYNRFHLTACARPVAPAC